MIASLRGNVLRRGLDHVVIEVGGVGMLVHTTPAHAAAAREGQPATYATTLVVREDSLTLYGFGDDDEKDLFELVQTVSGVGPRLALAMLAVHAPAPLASAISGGDLTALTKVPGIGKKGAERIVLELKDKVGAYAGGATPEAPAVAAGDVVHQQVADALVGLGWSARQATEAVTRVAEMADAPAEVAGLLRATLRDLGR
ncbi:Holliday junction branch migration protein RuvA [Calidifontibacter terrae]